MAIAINRNAFCADYSELTLCLLAIQNAAKNGLFNSHPEVLGQIRVFENDTLDKLHLRSIRILGILYGIEGVPSYSLEGDFEEFDFTYLDFWTGFIDVNHTGSVAVFQTILNIFKELCSRSEQLNENDKAALNDALMAVLDAFNILKGRLKELGFNLCGFEDDANAKKNTPGVFLQVAGSDGVGGIAEGLHLRWSFTGAMAALHIAKGDYFSPGAAVSGYNKANDYVHISRIPYSNPAEVNIDFEQDRPIVNSFNLYWTYVINQTANGIKLSNRVRLKFTDRALYNELARQFSPNSNYFAFLKQYSAIIEIEIIDRTAFKYTFEVGSTDTTAPAFLKIEAMANFDQQADDEDIFVRKTLVLAAETDTATITADNMSSVRLKKSSSAFLKKMSFETYYDFLATRSQNDWSTVGDGFALSITDGVVFDRLENTDFQVDNLWPLYNDGTRTRVANYQDRWSVSNEGDPALKILIQDYLSKSETDPRANLEIFEEGKTTDSQMISMLDAIQIQALDYHVARMLGLGHIDTPATVSVNDQFVYRLTYTNKESIDGSVVVDYSYMSLPTSKLDKRLPEIPFMRPLSYHLYIENQDFVSPFDENGYGKLENLRVVNIGRASYLDELPGHNFFADLSAIENSNIFERSRAIFYGLEYRADTQSGYVKPEITSEVPFGKIYYAYDDDFPETGVPEPILLPDDVDSLYIHFEKQEGVHHYALYGVNWFSRAVTGPEVATDYTIFPLRNTLTSPSDLTAQYIQKEESLIFTTRLEQTWLEGRTAEFPDEDVSFTRLTFNWLDITDITALGDKITEDKLQQVIKPNQTNVWFRPNFPLEVIGIVSDVIPVNGFENRVMLITGSYQLITGETISPGLASTDFNRFKNSLLSTPEAQFRVIEISSKSGFPTITIEKAYDTVRVDGVGPEDGSTIFGSRKEYISPIIGSRFTMLENLSNVANWLSVKEKIELVSFADKTSPFIETHVDSEGNKSMFWIGGITGNALITKIFDEENIFSGHYKVVFENNISLEAHPQVNIPFDPANPAKNIPGQLHMAHVEWYKGQARMSTVSGGEKKLLQVEVLNQANELTLVVFDPGFNSDPVIISQNETDTIVVNFHPSYRVYLFPEPAPGNVFNRGSIMPQADENDRRTLISIQHQDSLISGFTTEVIEPAILMARNIYEPQQIDPPTAPNLKVRPDTTSKAAFTFDMRLAPLNGNVRNPFGFMFYRTSHVDVLQALFAPETVTSIFMTLAALKKDNYFTLRYLELVNLIFDAQNSMHFKVYEALPAPYGFPVPDKQGLVNVADSDTQKIAKYKLAIQATLLPLTEQPPIYKYIKQGLQTSNNLPVIRDIDGNLINAGDPKFDPFPMIRRFTKDADPGAGYIRITDYFLNASSRDFYFYAGAEINNLLVTGPLSLFCGPVEVLQTMPAEAPIVSSFAIVSPPVIDLEETAVIFKIASIPLSDHISKIRAYRTTDLDKAVSIHQMESHFDTLIDSEAITGYELTDIFEDFAVIPLGRNMYYRLVGVRMIINEFDEEEEVLSLPTAIIPIKLIDTRNPDAPDLNYDVAENQLSWNPTTFDGTYYLYRQNNRGNWERIYTVQPALTNTTMTYHLPAPLVIEDGDGNRIYYRFKVQVQNASGLLNLNDNELTV